MRRPNGARISGALATEWLLKIDRSFNCGYPAPQHFRPGGRLNRLPIFCGHPIVAKAFAKIKNTLSQASPLVIRLDFIGDFHFPPHQPAAEIR
jgi:hypothetical protein